MRSGTILIMLYESPYKMSLGLNHHFLTTSRNVEQRLRSQPLISYSAILLFQSIVVSSFFHIVANVLQYETIRFSGSVPIHRWKKLESEPKPLTTLKTKSFILCVCALNGKYK